MEEYVKEQQVINGWDNVSIPVLTCCIQNGLVIDLKIDQLPRVYQGLVYGYPFYTLLPYNYKSFDGDL